MAWSEEELGSVLRELRAEYVPALAEQVASIEPALSTAEGRTGARATAHMIKGTSGAYGLPDVSQAASALEQAILTLPHDDAKTLAAFAALQEATRAATLALGAP